MTCKVRPVNIAVRRDFTNVITARGRVQSHRTAPLTLTASNSYTGSTIISAGTLFLTNRAIWDKRNDHHRHRLDVDSAVVLIRRSPCWRTFADRQRTLNGSLTNLPGHRCSWHFNRHQHAHCGTAAPR